MPTLVAVFLTVFVGAPLVGVFVERLLMRFLVDSPIVAQLVVTIGLMLALMGLAASIWNPNTSRIIPRFFGQSGANWGDTFVPYYRMVTIFTGVAVGIALRFLLYHTRLGVTMRAVVDNRTAHGVYNATRGAAVPYLEIAHAATRAAGKPSDHDRVWN